jgi:hypothetical protein
MGTTSPQYPLHIAHPTYGQAYISGGTAADFLMYHTNAPANARWTGIRSQDGRGKISSFTDIATYRQENILTWDNASGNVGVGLLPSPVDKMSVAGNVRVNGAGNGIIFPDGSKMTTAPGAAPAPSGTSIINAVNDPATVGTIGDNHLPAHLAKVNIPNTFNASQTVNGTVTANGRVESTSGGFKFPDGSVQATAAGKTFTTFPFTSDIEIGQPGGGNVTILQLDLPPGSYMVTATVQFANRGLFNKRFVACQLINEATWFFRIEGSGGAMDQIPITMHTVITQGGTVKLSCSAIDGGGRSNIFAQARRFTAIRLGDLVTVP